MTVPSEPNAPRIDYGETALQKVLSSHGYGFQYATLRRCLEAKTDQPWQSAVAEYPVVLNGDEIHIDFVLGSGTHLVVAECKRVDPSLARWGFARSAWLRGRLSSIQDPRFDYLTLAGGELRRDTRSVSGWKAAPFDVAVELRVREAKGNPYGTSRGNIESAISQVMRARGGLMEELAGTALRLRYGGGAIVPVIFTTASLLTTEADLTEADVQTGEFQSLEAAMVDWLWYDYNLSPSLRPRITRIERKSDSAQITKTETLRGVLSRDSTRSIAVVTPGGIEPFLKTLRWLLEHGSDPV